MMEYWFGGMGLWMLFGGLLMLLFWGGIIAIIVWGIKRVTDDRGSSSRTGNKPAPLDIAKERYAKGEISREDFDQLKRDLS